MLACLQVQARVTKRQKQNEAEAGASNQGQQKEEGRLAKGPTKVEIQDFVDDVHEVVVASQCGPGEQPSSTHPLPHLFPAIYSLDNASINEPTAEWKASRKWFFRHPLPPYSPDLHKVIEHTHTHVVAVFEGQLQSMARPAKTIDEYSQMVLGIFKDQVKPQSIMADTRDLERTCKEVLRLDGQLPAPDFR